MSLWNFEGPFERLQKTSWLPLHEPFENIKIDPLGLGALNGLAVDAKTWKTVLEQTEIK